MAAGVALPVRQAPRQNPTTFLYKDYIRGRGGLGLDPIHISLVQAALKKL